MIIYKTLLCAEQKDGEVYEVVEMPPEEEEETKESEEKEQTAAPTGLVKVFRFIMKQSYVCALIAMMVSQPNALICSLDYFSQYIYKFVVGRSHMLLKHAHM